MFVISFVAFNQTVMYSAENNLVEENQIKQMPMWTCCRMQIKIDIDRLFVLRVFLFTFL